MAERTLPGLGLTAFWPSGADGWGGEMDNNIRTLSAVAQLSVLSSTTVLPEAANDGDIFIVPSGQDANGVAVRDAGQWVIMSPNPGWSAWVVDTSKRIVFTGSSWVDESTGGGGEGGVRPYGGARIVPAADQNYTTLSAWDTIRFSAAERDTDGFWSASAPNVLTIPAGVTKVRLSASLKVASGGISLNQFEIRRVGGGVAGISEDSASQNTYSNPCASITTDVLDVVEGEQFEVRYYVSNAFLLEAGAKTWFSLEVVERTLANVGLNAKVSNLLDVDGTTAPVVGDTLVWNGTEYVPGKPVVNVNAAQGMYKPFRGAMAKLSADKSIGISPISAIQFDATEYDTNSFWSAGSPGRLTVPAGVKKVKLSACLAVQANTWGTSNYLFISFRKNGVNFLGYSSTSISTGYNDGGISINSPALEVTEGDFFEVRVNSSKTTTIGASVNSHFAIEVVEAEETLP